MKGGGGAFPYSHDVREYFGNYGGSQVCLHQSDGMTLRDYFAGQALIAFAHDYLEQKSRINRADLIIAENAYKLADAMLAEREKEK